MPLTLGGLLEAGLLVVNGMAVLQDTTPSTQPDAPPVPRFLRISERERERREQRETETQAIK